MTPDERALLQRFLQDLTATRGVYKDRDAESMILDALRASPDAAYVLVQHAIMSDQALNAAQDRISHLEGQLRNAPAPVSPTPAFGGGPSPWAQAAQPQPQWSPQPAPQPAQAYYGPGPFSSGGGLGSFLRNVGATAAGVAGGELLFGGITSLFGGHRGFGFGGFGGGYGGPTEVINNYYEDGGSGGGGWDDGGSGGGWDDGGDT